MKSVYDVQQLLKRFGIYIYTGNRNTDLELMQLEIKGLYEANLLEIQVYQVAILLLKKEIRNS